TSAIRSRICASSGGTPASATCRREGSVSAAGSSPGACARVSDVARPAFYALSPGSWRDYVTLLHPPYTAWHLSYVVIGGALAPHWYPGRLGAALGAVLLAVGMGAHALDELNGRPLSTQIPSTVLGALAGLS